MGNIVRQGADIVYRQADGEITAWLTGFEEKMELSHEGSPRFKKTFYLLTAGGVLYLLLVFLLY
jgi:hypothetical protein